MVRFSCSQQRNLTGKWLNRSQATFRQGDFPLFPFVVRRVPLGVTTKPKPTTCGSKSMTRSVLLGVHRGARSGGQRHADFHLPLPSRWALRSFKPGPMRSDAARLQRSQVPVCGNFAPTIGIQLALRDERSAATRPQVPLPLPERACCNINSENLQALGGKGRVRPSIVLKMLRSSMFAFHSNLHKTSRNKLKVRHEAAAPQRLWHRPGRGGLMFSQGCTHSHMTTHMVID